MKNCLKWGLIAWLAFVVFCILGTQSLFWGLLIGVGLPFLPFVIVGGLLGGFSSPSGGKPPGNTIYVQHLRDRRLPTHEEMMQEHYRRTRGWR